MSTKKQRQIAFVMFDIFPAEDSMKNFARNLHCLMYPALDVEHRRSHGQHFHESSMFNAEIKIEAYETWCACLILPSRDGSTALCHHTTCTSFMHFMPKEAARNPNR